MSDRRSKKQKRECVIEPDAVENGYEDHQDDIDKILENADGERKELLRQFDSFIVDLKARKERLEKLYAFAETLSHKKIVEDILEMESRRKIADYLHKTFAPVLESWEEDRYWIDNSKLNAELLEGIVEWKKGKHLLGPNGHTLESLQDIVADLLDVELVRDKEEEDDSSHYSGDK